LIELIAIPLNLFKLVKEIQHGDIMKKIRFSLFMALFTSVFLISCAHHRDVRPGEGGMHRVVVATDDVDQGNQDAIAQAQHYCKESKKEAIFTNEESKYKGNMSEEDYNKYKAGAKVAKVVGGTTWALGNKTASGIGGAVGLGGLAAEAAIGKQYKVEMKFKCQ
jgi:hypothetical protein